MDWYTILGTLNTNSRLYHNHFKKENLFQNLSLHSKIKSMSSKGKSVAKTSIQNLRGICIISDTELVKDVSFSMAARELGTEMATRKITVVHNGEIQGLGATVAMTSINRRNDVLGIIQENSLGSSSTKKSHFSLGRELRAQNPYERMILMLQNSDAFIVMPGGLVILEMFASTILWANANVHKKPIGFLNVNGFFNGLLLFLTQADEQGFIPQGIRRLMVAAPTAGQLIDLLQGLVQESDPSAKQVVQYTGDKRKRDEPDTDLRL